MTVDEALREIGVAPGSNQEEIRRAYLRLVKVRKPETDPEGFRRLREAFELLRDLPEAPPEIRFHPQPAEKRPVRQQAEPEEVAAEPADVVRLILQLQAEGQAAGAERIQERFQRRLQSSSRELSLLDDQTAALWQIAQEISGLSADFRCPRASPSARRCSEALRRSRFHGSSPRPERTVTPDGAWRPRSRTFPAWAACITTP
jgi:curved DNA-binding protein CbpA